MRHQPRPRSAPGLSRPSDDEDDESSCSLSVEWIDLDLAYEPSPAKAYDLQLVAQGETRAAGHRRRHRNGDPERTCDPRDCVDGGESRRYRRGRRHRTVGQVGDQVLSIAGKEMPD